MDPYAERLQEFAEETLAAEQKRIAEAIREAADRVIASMVPPTGDSADDPLLDREQAAAEFKVPYWKIRDLQLKGRVPTVRRGQKIYARRSDLAKVVARAAV